MLECNLSYDQDGRVKEGGERRRETWGAGQGVGKKEAVPRQAAARRRQEAGGVLVRRRQPSQGPFSEEAHRRVRQRV